MTQSKGPIDMKTRLILAGIVALLMAPFAAQAADLPQPYKARPGIVEPAYANWTGFYAGLNLGYGFGTADWPTPPPTSFDTNGLLVGGTLGYNFQTGTWVWGIEGDLDYSTIKGNDNNTVCAGPNGGCNTKLKWLSTIRGRIGYGGWGNWMPYFTGGAAIASVENSDFATETSTKTGWTVGLGIEYAFRGNWSAKLEYLYADLGSMTCQTCTVVPQEIDYKLNIVRAGINYRF
jgi:outer membrane immunogenic protein